MYCTLDEDGWYTLTKPEALGSGMTIHFMTSATNIPAGVYSFRVIFKDLYGSSVGYNIGSFVALYNVTGNTNTENRAFTRGFDSNRDGYNLSNLNFTQPIKNLYLWISSSTVIPTPVTFKVQLVKNSFFEDRVEIPSEVQALEGYGLGLSKDNCNYIEYLESSDSYYYMRAVNKYTFTGTEYLEEMNPATLGAKYYRYHGIVDDVYLPKDDGITTEHLLFEGENTLPFAESLYYEKKEGVSINTTGKLCIYRSDIQTVTDMQNYLKGKSFIYLRRIPGATSLEDEMKDFGYIQVQEGGTITFENEHKYDVPNTITYALKVV